jgi:hypothetical protein
VEGHFIHAVFHRGEPVRRRVPGGVHLVSQLLHQHFQLVKLGIVGCKVARQWRLVSKVGLDWRSIKGIYRRWLPATVCVGPPI